MFDSPSGLPTPSSPFEPNVSPPQGDSRDSLFTSRENSEILAQAHGTSLADSLPERRFGWLGYGIASLCWTFILGFVALTLANPYQPNEEVDPEADVPLQFPDVLPGMIEVGSLSWAPNAEEREKMSQSFQEAAEAAPGPYNLRLARAIVIGERLGPVEAREQLSKIDTDAEAVGYQPKATELSRRQALDKLYANVGDGQWELPDVTTAERDDLKTSLGWYGELALAPPGSPTPIPERAAVIGRAQSLMGMAVGFFGIGFLIMMASFLMCVLAVILAATGRIRFDQRPVVARGTVYLETFVLWLVCFIAFPLLLHLVAPAAWESVSGLIGATASLVALIWPLLRGVPFGEMLQDVGLRWTSTVVEVLTGAAAYLVGLPFVAGSLFFSLMLVAVFTPQPETGSFESVSAPSHPIQQMVGSGDWQAFLIVALAAVVMAPIMEEIVFRGVLFRHLREVTGGWYRLISVMISASVTAFIFAAIHPQGILLVPVLGMLGALFAVVREWRGSVIAPMTMHAIHNGILITITITVVVMTSG